MTPGRSLRYEWEVALRGAQLAAEKGGSSAALVGFVLATYADADGTRIFPGEQRVANGLGVDVRTVQRAMAALRGRGFIERVSGGNSRAGKAAEWRLTIPGRTSDVSGEVRPTTSAHPTPLPDHPTPWADHPSPLTASNVTDDVPPAQNQLILTNSSTPGQPLAVAKKKSAWAMTTEQLEQLERLQDIGPSGATTGDERHR